MKRIAGKSNNAVHKINSLDETRKISKGQKNTLSKTKLLEQILAERYNLEALIKENELYKK